MSDDILQMGITAQRNGKLRQAEQFYNTVLQSDPFQPDANHNLGIISLNRGEQAQALPFLRKALEARPQHGPFWLSYIEVLIGVNQFDLAKTILDQGKGIGLKGKKVNQLEDQLQSGIANQSVSRTNRSNIISLYNEGKLSEAEAMGKLLIKKHSNEAEYHNILGAIFVAMNKNTDAINSYNTAIKLQPNYAEAHNNKGIALKNLKKIEPAIESFYAAIGLKFDYAEAYNNLGNILENNASIELAFKNYKRALLLKADYAETYYNLGLLEEKRDQFNDALLWFAKAITLRPSYPEAYYGLGNNLIGLDEYSSGKTNYLRALVLRPEYTEVYGNFGLVLEGENHTLDAKQLYEKAIILSPKIAANKVRLSRILYAEEKFSEAIDVLVRNLNNPANN